MLNHLMSKILALAAVTLATSDLGAQVRIGGSISIGIDRPVRRIHEVIRPIVQRHVCVQGHWETIEEKVWVAGECVRTWVPPVYHEYRDRCGFHRVLVSAGYWRTEERPGHWEIRCRQVWVAGCGCGHTDRDFPARHGRHRE